MTGAGDQGANWTRLASGTVPAAGPLAVSVPVTTLSKSNNHEFMLVMSKRIDGSHRYLAVALEGPPAAQLAADHTITFSPSTATVAPVYPTIAAARAASGCATCKATTKPAHQSAPAPGEPARVPMRAPGPARGTQTRHLAQPTASDPALTAGDTALLPTPSVPAALCAVDNACGAATPVARNPGQCDNNIGLFSQTSNCTIDAQEISGVDAKGRTPPRSRPARGAGGHGINRTRVWKQGYKAAQLSAMVPK